MVRKKLQMIKPHEFLDKIIYSAQRTQEGRFTELIKEIRKKINYKILYRLKTVEFLKKFLKFTQGQQV